MYARWLNQRFGAQEETLSILDLVNYGTIDCKLAGLLWLLMEHRASVLVAAGPIFAGKTTLLRALLDFLPPDLERISLRGHYEDYKFLEQSKPEKSYLVAEEISNHGYFEYLWGFHAVRVFSLLSQGYSLGSTIHARTSEEAVYILHRVLGIPLETVSLLGIIVTLRVTGGTNYDDEPVRRINSVDLLLPHQEGLAIHVLAAQQHTAKGFDYQAEKALEQVLTNKRLVGKLAIHEEIQARKQFLTRLLKEGKSSRKQVREAILEYYSQNLKNI